MALPIKCNIYKSLKQGWENSKHAIIAPVINNHDDDDALNGVTFPKLIITSNGNDTLGDNEWWSCFKFFIKRRWLKPWILESDLESTHLQHQYIL